jgi:hypothetical protein
MALRSPDDYDRLFRLNEVRRKGRERRKQRSKEGTRRGGWESSKEGWEERIVRTGREGKKCREVRGRGGGEFNGGRRRPLAPIISKLSPLTS